MKGCSPMNLQKQLRCVYLHAFTSTLRFTDAVWVALLAARGFTLAQIGLAEGVFHGVSLLCEVPSGMAADLLGRRRTLIFGGALGVVSAATMAFAPSLAFICAGMGLKALGYNLLSGTTEALTYDSLKTAGRERDYIKVDAKASIFMKLASALGALASLLAGVLTSAGYYLADAAVSAVSALAAANLTEPVVTDEQAAREKHILQELPARLRVHILDSLDCLCSSTPGAAHYHGRRGHLAAVLPDLDVRPAAADPAGLGHGMAVSAGSAGRGRGHGGRIAGPPPAPQTAARALFRLCAARRHRHASGGRGPGAALRRRAGTRTGGTLRLVPAQYAAAQRRDPQ